MTHGPAMRKSFSPAHGHIAKSLPQPPAALARGAAGSHTTPLRSREQRMRLQRLRLEFGMELAAQEERVVGNLDDLDVGPIGGRAADAQSAGGQRALVLAIELVAMAMALADLVLAVGLVCASVSGSSLQVHAPSRMVPPNSSTPRNSRSL